MQSLIVTITFIFLFIIGFINTQDNSFSVTTNCGSLKEDSTTEYIDPIATTNCTRAAMINFQTCCHASLTLNSDSTVKQICVALTTIDKKTDAENYYKAVGDYSNAVVTCPTISAIPNSCGIAGIYQPIDATDCNKINIPETNCCLVKAKVADVEHLSCRRIDEKPTKDTKNETIKTELNKWSATITSIECFSSWINYYYAYGLIIIIMMMVLIV